MRKNNAGGPTSGGRGPSRGAVDPAGRRWTFLSRHAQVLLCVSRQDDLRIKEIAERVGLAARAVQLILRDLIREGYVSCERVGRRNRYEVRTDRPMRHPLVAHRGIEALLALVDDEENGGGPGDRA